MKIALVLLATLSACTPGIYRAPLRPANYYSIRADGSRSEVYSRVNEWTSYGTHGLGAQAAIAAAYEDAQHAPPPVNDVEIWNATLPPGVTLEHGTVKIDPQARYEAVGRFEVGYWQSSAPREAEIEPDLRRLAQVVHGDTVIVEVQRFDHADDRIDHMNGIVLRKHAAVQAASRPEPPHEHARAHLVYEARGAGCPGEDEFADEVSAKLGYSPWQADAPAVRTEIGAGNGAFYATVSLAGGASRALQGASCRAVSDAAIIAIVVELEDRARAKPAR